MLPRIRAWLDSGRAGPDVLTGYILLVTGVAMGEALRTLPWWSQAAMALCGAAAVACLWLTHLSDPGVLPARAEKDPTVAALESGQPLPDALEFSRDKRGAWVRRADLPGWRGPLVAKYCESCHIWRPPRAHHCSECDACIERFDHHCDVVGACIGAGNHRFFAAFLVAAQAGCAIMAAGATVRLRRAGFPGSSDAARRAETWVLLGLAVVGAYQVLALLFGSAHMICVLLNITTKDLLRDSQLCRNPPCCPGGRSPAALAWALWASIRAPVRWRWQNPAPPGGSGGAGARAAAAGDGTAAGDSGGWLLEGNGNSSGSGSRGRNGTAEPPL